MVFTRVVNIECGRVMSDLSFGGLMKLVEDVVRMNVSVVYITIKEHHTNVMAHEEAKQHVQRSGETVEGQMSFSNDTVRLEDNTTLLKDDTATYEDDMVTLEDDDASDQVKIEHGKGVDLRDVQCNNPIANNPIAGANGISLLETLANDSY
ncbi:Uncharacterized protein TCM_017741 [Theobroma cacao]|uniref:Uncharacterized protein n=1 Tax=Theobroma cacao TaxID=3641 RepID=A0A061EE37_THECC|nr:Uncharacterized protein TCM_017741 [Theobroma cacao]